MSNRTLKLLAAMLLLFGQGASAQTSDLGGHAAVLKREHPALYDLMVRIERAHGIAFGGLAPEGKLIIVGAPAEPMSVSALPLIFGRRSIMGWPSGTSMDSQETLKFAQQAGVKPRVELFSLDDAQAAYDRMLSGEARFRVVMTMR